MKNNNFNRRFLPLFVTQFLGAFNDNLFKSALLIFAAYAMPEKAGLTTNLIAGLFILPFFLFSATAGLVTARCNRRRLAVSLKITELLLMLTCAAVYHLQNLTLLTLLLFLMGTQSTFFGPVKYALLPQLLTKDELIKGNAYTEGGTYLSIILGSVLGAALPFTIVLGLLSALAVAGLVSAAKIPDAPAPLPEQKIHLNIFKETVRTISLLKKNKIIFRTIWGITWFWMVGAFCLTEIFPLASTVLNVTPSVVSLFLLLFSSGVGLGSYLSCKILKNRIDLFYVPLASLCITLCGFLIFVLTIGAQPATTPLKLAEFICSFRGGALIVLFTLMAIAGGIYVVPLNTLLQKTTPPGKLAQIIAGNNIVNSLGMVAVAGLSALLIAAGLSVPALFFIISLGNLAVATYISALYPKELVKSLFRLLLRALYRVKCEGFENITAAGSKVLIISNHTSLLDGILIAAFMPKSVCFAINTEWTKHPFVRLFSRIIDFYPIDTENPLSIRNLIGELNKNKTIMMFPEGRISVTGNLMKVYDGAGMVASLAGANILPLRIDGASLSKFSYLGSIMKTRWFPKIRLQMLPAQQISLTCQVSGTGEGRRQQIANTLFKIMQQMMTVTEQSTGNLFKDLLKAKSKYGNKKIIEDGHRHAKTYSEFIKLIKQQRKKIKRQPSATLPAENNIETAALLFALWSLNQSPVMADGTLLPPQSELFAKQAEAYYRFGTNARDVFFNDMGLNSIDGLIYGLLMPLLSGAKVFLNTSSHNLSDLIYDTDTTVLCLNKTDSLPRLGKSANRLDFYALRKVWLFAPAIADDNTKTEWLMRFGLRLKNMS